MEKKDLLLKKKNDVLNDEEKALLKEVCDYVDSLFRELEDGEEPEEPDFDVIQVFLHLSEEGFVPSDEKRNTELAEALINDSIDEYFSLPEVYPEAVPYLLKLTDHYGPGVLVQLADPFREGKYQNDEIYFGLVCAGADYEMSGMMGGFSLVNTLINIDLCRLLKADCLMKGIGTEKNYVKAFFTLYHMNRDHLTQKNESIDLCDSWEELYASVKEDVDAGKEYPGLFYIYGIMHKEGLGTAYDYHLAEKYLDKEKTYAEYVSNYRERVMNTKDGLRPIISVKKITDSLKKGDYVSYGKYDERNLLWKVLNVTEENALLVCSEVIESSYIANAAFSMISSSDSFQDAFLNGKFSYGLPDMEENLVKTDRGYVFLLNKGEVTSYMKTRKSRYCGARPQAIINGYDECGLYREEYAPSYPWWTSTEKDGAMVYVDEYGDFLLERAETATIGVRPAILLKRSEIGVKNKS